MRRFRNLLPIISLLLLLSHLTGYADDNAELSRTCDKYLTERQQMVEQQLQNRGITDPLILQTFLKIPRHLFVPKSYERLAYTDRALPIGEGQTISQPYIVAYMTQTVAVSPTDKILEIGTGSGYQAAILGELCDSVFTIEIMETLGQRASILLQDMGYRNIQVKIGDGYLGWEAHAPFDAIIVTCSPSKVPEALQNQLREGGRMIIPVGSSHRQELVCLRKMNNQLLRESVLPVLFVPMIDTSGTRY